MKITYNIKFRFEWPESLPRPNVECSIIDSPMGNLLARLHDRRYTNFISGQDVMTSVKALVTDGETLTIVDETYGRIPYGMPSGLTACYLPPGDCSTVDTEIRITSMPDLGRALVLEMNGKPLLFTGEKSTESKLYYSLSEARGEPPQDPPEKTVSAVDLYTLSHSDALASLFIRLVGTAMFSKFYPEYSNPYDAAQAEASKASTNADTQTGMPNHLLHGHDEDPVIQPPVPSKTIGEHIPDEPAAVPKYVQMVHHEEPVVNPPVPKKPVEAKGEPATHGEPCVVFAWKLYRAAAMAVVKFGDAEDTITPRQVLHELLPMVMGACDGYLDDPDGFGEGKALGLSNYPDKILLTITRKSIRLTRIKFDVEETIG